MKQLFFVCLYLVFAQNTQAQGLYKTTFMQPTQTQRSVRNMTPSHLAISTNPLNMAMYKSYPFAADLKLGLFTHNVRYAIINGMSHKGFFGNGKSATYSQDPPYVLYGREFSYTLKCDAYTIGKGEGKRGIAVHQYVGLRYDNDKYHNQEETFQVNGPGAQTEHTQAINITRTGVGIVTGIQMFNLFKFIYLDGYVGTVFVKRRYDLLPIYVIQNDNRFSPKNFESQRYTFCGGWRIGFTIF